MAPMVPAPPGTGQQWRQWRQSPRPAPVHCPGAEFLPVARLAQSLPPSHRIIPLDHPASIGHRLPPVAIHPLHEFHVVLPLPLGQLGDVKRPVHPVLHESLLQLFIVLDKLVIRLDVEVDPLHVDGPRTVQRIKELARHRARAGVLDLLQFERKRGIQPRKQLRLRHKVVPRHDPRGGHVSKAEQQTPTEICDA